MSIREWMVERLIQWHRKTAGATEEVHHALPNGLRLEEVRKLVQRASWYHSFELLPGIVTPGQTRVEPKTRFDLLGLSADLHGKKALDIGTWDGPYAFELERRGAEVTALDIQNPDHTGFNVAKSILGSQVRYVQASVYDLTKAVTGKFDVITFLGVFYHLKHPILAFEQIHDALADDGIVLFEGECFTNYAEDLQGRKCSNRLFLFLLAHSRIPMALCYSGHYKGASNWFIPNVACLDSWMNAAGLRVKDYYVNYRYQRRRGEAFWSYISKKLLVPPLAILLLNQHRIRGTAVKCADQVEQEHPVYQENWRR